MSTRLGSRLWLDVLVEGGTSPSLEWPTLWVGLDDEATGYLLKSVRYSECMGCGPSERSHVILNIEFEGQILIQNTQGVYQGTLQTDAIRVNSHSLSMQIQLTRFPSPMIMS